MFKLNFTLRRKGEDILIFSPPPWFRIFFLIIAVIIISGIVLNLTEGGQRTSVLAVIISIVCIAGALYEESWTFDRNKRLIMFKTGLIFLSRKKNLSFEAVENLSVSVVQRWKKSEDKNTDSGKIRRARVPRYNQELLLNLKSGECITIENFDGYNTEMFSKKAVILAGFCGFNLNT